MRSTPSVLLACAWILVAPAGGAQEGQDPPGPEPGPQREDALHPIVVEAEFEGLESYDPEGVLRTLGVTVGQPWPELLLYRKGVERVLETYGVVMRNPRFETVSGGVRVVFPVHELPVDLEPRFVGNDRISEEKLREWALLFEREQIYVHEADRVRTRLERGYRREGFHFVEVEAVVREEGDGGETDSAAADVIFEIREGPKVRVTRVRVEGNDSLPDTGWGFWRGGLRKMAKAETKGVGLLRWWGGVFDQEEVEADAVAMAEVYRNRGWLDAQIGYELDFNDARNEVRVTFLVDEGPLYRVRSVELEALEREWDAGRGGWGPAEETELLFPREELLGVLELAPGVPLERARIERDQVELGRYYGKRGYIPQDYFEDPRAGGWEWLEPEKTHDVEKHVVDVVYRFVQGRQRVVREVFPKGNLHTRDRVLRREISVQPGKRADLSEIERSLARIRGTGFFSDQLDPAHRRPTVRMEVDPEDPEKIDVIYEVEEGRVVNVSLSGGVTSDSGVLGLVSVSMKNFQAGNTPSGFWSSFGEIYRKEAFHGNGEVFLLDIAPGSQISFYRIFYSHPDILGSHFDRWTASGEFEDRLRRFRSHDERRRVGSLGLGRLFGQGDLAFQFGPQWMEIEIDDLDPVDSIPGTLQRSEEETVFQGLDLSLTYRKLDNRLSPNDGYFMRWANTVYGGPFGGDNDVWKSEYHLDWYTQLGPEEKDVLPGVYLGGGFGVAHPYGDTDEVHYAERNFLGGASTVRGFDFRGVGPNEGDFAIGGETFLRLSTEYRHPLYSTPIPGTSRRREMLRGFLFLDAGVLDPNSFELDLDEYRAAVGFGIALTSPLPLKFNFGFPIQQGDGDDTEVFSFTLDLR